MSGKGGGRDCAAEVHNTGHGLEPLNDRQHRALAFDAEKHKCLESELKCLYTAITRARVNCWFVDFRFVRVRFRSSLGML